MDHKGCFWTCGRFAQLFSAEVTKRSSARLAAPSKNPPLAHQPKARTAEAALRTETLFAVNHPPMFGYQRGNSACKSVAICLLKLVAPLPQNVHIGFGNWLRAQFHTVLLVLLGGLEILQGLMREILLGNSGSQFDMNHAVIAVSWSARHRA